MDDEEEVLTTTFDVSLPAADFQLESSEEDINDEHPIVVFNRADHMKTCGIDISSYNSDIDLDGYNTLINEDTDIVKDIIVEDIEGQSLLQNTATDSSITTNDEEWSQFRSNFESLSKQSEAEIQQNTTRDTIGKLKEDMILDMVAAFHPMGSTGVEEKPCDTVTSRHHTTDNEEINMEAGNMTNTQSTVKITTAKRPVRNNKGLVLLSNRFDGLIERDLDTVLEAIDEEESRESCVSPGNNGRAEMSFKWERVYDKAKEGDRERDEIIMNQLAAMCQQQQDVVTRDSNTCNNGSDIGNVRQTQGHEDIQWISRMSSNANNDTTFLDLRSAQQVHDDDDSSETAKHLLQMKLSTSTKSSSEDSDDPYSWKEQRRALKQSFGHNNEMKKSPTSPKSPSLTSHGNKVLSESTGTSMKGSTITNTSSSKKVTEERKRNPSSGSFSEDDLFVSSFNEGKTVSTTSDNSPTLSRGNQKKGKSSKKKKRKGKGRKDSVSGSDGEGNSVSNTKKKQTNESEKNKESNNTTNHVTGPVAVPINTQNKKETSRRLRHDSWPMSSDDDTASPRGPLVHGYSYSSDGESFPKDTEKVKQYLQKRIESRKPPHLFSTPITPPIFHQDVSFTTPISSTHPSCTPSNLLVLQLSDSGELPLNDVTVSYETLQLLRILLTVWLITLYTNNDIESNNNEYSTVSSHVSIKICGLLQTVVDGSVCVIAGLLNNDTVNDMNVFLKSTCICDVINPLMILPKYISHDMQQSIQIVSKLPLSTFLSIQTDTLPLMAPFSFYWNSLYDIKCLRSDNSLRSSSPLQVTVCTIDESSLSNRQLIFALLYQATCKGLDITGLRFAFENSSSVFLELAKDKRSGGEEVTLAIAFRGTHAIKYVQDIIGPDDTALAKITDPISISATFGIEGKKSSVTCVHSHFWAGLELAKWFGGRACPDTIAILGVSDANTRSERRKRQRVRFSESESEDLPLPLSLPDDIAFPPLVSNIPALTVYKYSKIIFVVSPLVVPLHYSTLLQSIDFNGFDIIAIKRVRLNTKRASVLKIPPTACHFFTPSSAPSSPELNPSTLQFTNNTDMRPLYPPLPSIVLILGKECALSHASPLITSTFSDIKVAYSNDSTANDSAHFDNLFVDDPSAFFHATEFNEEYLKVFGSFIFTPTHKTIDKTCNDELQDKPVVKEEVCVVSVIGNSSMDKSVELLNSILTKPVSDNDLGSIELLGIKLIPEVSRFHAKQIPSSITGTLLYQDAVDYITSKVALLFAFRGLNANDRIAKIVKANETRITTSVLRPRSEAFDRFNTSNINSGFELASCCFIDKELFCDTSCWALSGYVPPSWFNDCAVLSNLVTTPISLLSVFTISANNIRILVRVFDKLFRGGLKIVGLRLVKLQNENEDVFVSDTKDTDEFIIAVCVQRYNVVWQLCHDLTPFTSSSANLKFSRSFNDAIKDVQEYFSYGVHTLDQSVQKYYHVPSAPMDSFKLSSYSQLIPAHLPPPSVSSLLMETTCIIIQPSIFTMNTCSTVLDVLNKATYTLGGLIMTELSVSVSESICDIMNYRKEQAVEFIGSTCLIVLVTRDNGATCYESIITSAIDHTSSIREETSSVKSLLINNIHHTTTSDQSNALKKLFFSNYN